MKCDFTCIVVGSGVAGMTAALYLKRSNISVLLLEKDVPGGQINKTTEIENYPGFAKVHGSDLALSMVEQLKNIDVSVSYGNVVDVIDKGDYKIVKTDRLEYTCRFVVLATGRIPRTLGLEGESSLVGRGISYCAICDGYFYKDKDVVIVGGGNSALTGALYLSSLCKSVTILNRSDVLRADSIFLEKIKKCSNVTIQYNAKVTKLFSDDNHLHGIEINHLNKMEISGLFIYIGFDPDLSYLKSLSIVQSGGYIVVDKSMRTSNTHIYACGDIIFKDVYQISTAIGDAAIAATTISHENEK